jgi:hypothetical protein
MTHNTKQMIEDQLVYLEVIYSYLNILVNLCG